MNATLKLLTVSLILCGWASAGVPRKPTVRQYTKLWTDSPFTAKPEPAPVEEKLVFEDYTLAGVSPIGDGYRVTLLEKKDPTKRIIVDSDRTNEEGFKLLAVTRKTGDPLGTVVRMTSGGKTGSIAFEDKFLKLKAPPAKKLPQKPGAKPAVKTPTPNTKPGQRPVRQPRPRVVPPPTNNKR